MNSEDFIPVLSAGDHEDPSQGACVMEMVSFMAGEEWTDRPQCVHPTIASVARHLNDVLKDEDRHLILSQFDRFFGTTVYSNKVGDALTEYLFEVEYQYGTYMTDVLGYLCVNNRAEEAINLLKELIDVYDRVTGRTDVEKQDLTRLKDLQTT